MKKPISLLLGMMLMAAASAGTTPLASYTHNYGINQFDPGGNDVLGNGFVTVSDQSTERFSDTFDFGALNFSAIDRFELVLNYSGISATRTCLIGICADQELWYVRPGGTDQYTPFRLDRTGGTPTSSVFMIDAGLPSEFSNMVGDKAFYFWFAEDTLFADSFQLNSATLEVYGQAPVVPETAVPEPTSLALLGLGLTGLAASLRRRTKKAA